jgi:2',3'-cyclic-nucleotide 2'-phosphodiesterase (5'-nucleotidase family)
MIDLLNQVGIDAMALGNHEFDFGPEVALERIGEARFPVLAANVLRDGKPLPGTAPTWMVERGGIQLGFVGLTTLQTQQISSPGDVTFNPIVESARAAARTLREQGADLVVALAHTSMDEDLALVQSGVAEIVLSGHDHLLMSYYNGKTVLVESGAQGDFVTVLDIVVDRTKGRDGKDAIAWRPTVRSVPTAGITPDPRIAAAVKAYADQLDQQLGQPIARVAGTLDSRRNVMRGGEAAIGDLVADALRARLGADVALLNAGALRGDRQYDPGTTLTRGDVMRELSFGHKAVKLEVTGAQLLAALENGLSQLQQGAGRFPQVSGMAIAYAPQGEAGKRVREVKVGGQDLDPARKYTLVTNDFLAGGGDGYSMLKEARPLVDANAGPLVTGVVIDHLAAAGTVEARVDGRLRAVPP